MEIYVKISFISIFYFLWFSIMISLYKIGFTYVEASNTATYDVTNWVTHRIVNTIQTYNILVLILYSKLMRYVAALVVLTRFNDDS